MKQLNNKKALRKFGRNFTIVFAVWGLIFWWRGKSIYPLFFSLAVIFLILTLFFPQVLDPIERNWLRLTKLISKTISTTALIIFFYLVLTPIGFLHRLFGGKFLDLKIDKEKASYWITRKKEKRGEGDYTRQF